MGNNVEQETFINESYEFFRNSIEHFAFFHVKTNTGLTEHDKLERIKTKIAECVQQINTHHKDIDYCYHEVVRLYKQGYIDGTVDCGQSDFDEYIDDFAKKISVYQHLLRQYKAQLLDYYAEYLALRGIDVICT